MRNLILFFIALGLACASCKTQPQRQLDDGAIVPPPDDAASEDQDAAASVHDAAAEDAAKAGGDPKLIDYLATSMTSWRKGDIEFYRAVASDIADVVESEPPIWKGDETHARTAVLVATIAFFEGGFQTWVDRGLCNDEAWTQTHEGRMTMLSGGDCDGGLGEYRHGWAYSLWQVHPQEGIVLQGDVWTRADNMTHEWRAAHRDEIVSGPMMIASRPLAARVALHMLRLSMSGTGNLIGYTGESYEKGCHPKADVRLSFAERWSSRHPFKLQESSP